MKTHGGRSSAIRAARKAGLKDGEFEVVQVWQEGGKSSWQYVAKGETPATVATEPVAIEEKGAVTVEVTEAPVPAPEPQPQVDRVRESTIEKPTKAVWTIADEMKAANPNVTHKQIVDECVRRGVAFYTARTQYQRWAKSKGATQSSPVE